MSLQKVFDGLLPQIEAELQEIVRIPPHNLGAYYGMMQYHLGWTDEALRPIQTNSGKRLIDRISLRKVMVYIAFHEYGAPVADDRRFLALCSSFCCFSPL